MTAYVADLSALTSPAANDFMLVSDTSDPLNTDKKMALQYLALKSGTPTAGRVASWTDANQIQDGGFLVSDFARKTGTPTGGRIASWTDANAVQDGGFLAADAIRKPTAVTPVVNNLVRWNAANTVDDAGIAVANVPQKSGTLVAGNNAHWSNTTGTLVDSGFAASAIARKSGTPAVGNITNWIDANTIQDSTIPFADVGRLSLAQTYTGRITAQTGIISGSFSIGADSFAQFTPPMFGGMLFVWCDNSSLVMGIFNFRRTAYLSALALGANMVQGAGALNGTTGTAGKVTVSITSDLYIENRLGAARTFYYLILG